MPPILTSPISSLALVTNRSSIASPLRQLFTLYPFLDVEGDASSPPSSPVPSEQPVAIDSHTPVMGFVPPSFSNGKSPWLISVRLQVCGSVASASHSSRLRALASTPSLYPWRIIMLALGYAAAGDGSHSEFRSTSPLSSGHISRDPKLTQGLQGRRSKEHQAETGHTELSLTPEMVSHGVSQTNASQSCPPFPLPSTSRSMPSPY
ncbi:hypothetical protein QYF61_025157 [Mycteria americana]|uniref:Uncharacterized protein n=1 Tax=Mycteria americana TaxID=33587 RepID=A0AAN7SJK1_MYCAM|nr:hypothetical protein QYF61_025157 [Mycteria americana]